MRLWLSFFFLTCFVLVQGQTTGLSWYRQYRGKIDQLAVTIHLHKSGNTYKGYYYYDTRQQPIFLSGEDSVLKGKIQLIGFVSYDETEKFVLNATDTLLSGTWKKSEKSKPLEMQARFYPMPFHFSYVYTTANTRLRPKMKDSPEASYESAAVWPEGSSTTEKFIKKVIRKMVVPGYKGSEDIGAFFIREKKKLLDNYRKDYATVKDSELREMASSYSLDESNQLMITFYSEKILSLAYSNYSYTGGAHGNYGTFYTALDLSRNKELELKDILTDAGTLKLQSLLERNFRRQFKLKSTDSLTEAGLFENKIEPNSNFYITGKGLAFAYSPYEIGPYVMGEIDIFIPFRELEAYLRPAFKKLIS
jgi:hypothetical protein